MTENRQQVLSRYSYLIKGNGEEGPVRLKALLIPVHEEDFHIQ